MPREQIYEVTFAGNTTMQQLLCGIDPRPLGEVPFVPAAGRGLALPAAELGLHIHPRGRACVLPVIGGFVGGDTVAGILATGLADAPGPTLLVDIGTNGEIVLAAGGKLAAASTAAGPAFEARGSPRACGAATGAIEKVVVDGRLRINVIGDVPPLGLCGSGLIDAAAELLRHGMLAPQGRLLTPDELPAGVLPDLARRIVLHDGQVGLPLADRGGDGRRPADPAHPARPARAAIGHRGDPGRHRVAACSGRAGAAGPGSRAAWRAGSAISSAAAMPSGSGCCPAGIEHHRIRYQGNTSLAGRGWRPSRGDAAAAGRRACPRGPSTSIFRSIPIPPRLRRGDDLSGAVAAVRLLPLRRGLG